MLPAPGAHISGSQPLHLLVAARKRGQAARDSHRCRVRSAFGLRFVRAACCSQDAETMTSCTSSLREKCCNGKSLLLYSAFEKLISNQFSVPRTPAAHTQVADRGATGRRALDLRVQPLRLQGPRRACITLLEAPSKKPPKTGIPREWLLPIESLTTHNIPESAIL